MAEPTPMQKVTTNFSQDKAAKRKFLSIAGVILIVFLGAVFLKRRSQTENPVTKAVESEQRRADQQTPPAVQGPGDTKTPMDQAANASGVDDVFLRQMQDFDRQQKEQKKADDQRSREQQNQAIQQARMEERQKATTPPSVGPDGTPLPAGQQVQTMIPPPPRYDYESSAWMPAGSGRIRPAYQTGALYPSDPNKHQEFDQAYWDGLKSPIVVGLDSESNAAAARLKQDTSQIRGGLGTRSNQDRVIQTNVPNVNVRRQSGGDASHWGGWIVVTPLGPKKSPSSSSTSGSTSQQ